MSTDAPTNTHARDNAGTTFTNADKGVPIYWLNGPKVADNYQDFHDGSWDSDGGRNENGVNVGADTVVWSGSRDAGTRYYAAGPPGDSEQVSGGQPRSSVTLHAHDITFPSNGYKPLFALSPVLTVVAPTPHKAATPTVAWGPTRNSVRIEFAANDHTYSEHIYNYAVQVRGGQWTDWTTVTNVNHGEGTITKVVTGLRHSTDYRLRIWARARLAVDVNKIYYGPASNELLFTTRASGDPDPATGFRAHEVFYNRVDVRWHAPSHTGNGPLQQYRIEARRWTGSAFTSWGWAATLNANATSREVTLYTEGGNFVNFQPGTHYQLRIRALNGTGRGSAWSEIVAIQTLSPVPVAPNKPRISNLRHDSVRVHWDGLTNDGASRVYSWAVQTRQPKPGGGFTPWTTVAHPGGSARFADLTTGLRPSAYNHNTGVYTASHYQVRVWARARTCATCKIFYSPGSDERGFDMRTRSPSAPAAPTLSDPQTDPQSGTQSIEVSWQPPDWLGETGVISHYDVYVLVGSDWRISRPTPGMPRA